MIDEEEERIVLYDPITGRRRRTPPKPPPKPRAERVSADRKTLFDMRLLDYMWANRGPGNIVDISAEQIMVDLDASNEQFVTSSWNRLVVAKRLKRIGRKRVFRIFQLGEHDNDTEMRVAAAKAPRKVLWE